ncbi:MAG: TonB-dependent receptor [Bacteroidota bacterium]|nr:TonB-dependent receptor [Bacteroidota bacterium]
MQTSFKFLRTNLYFLLVIPFMLLIFFSGNLNGGTTGKLSGRVISQANEALPSANIQIVGTSLGASSDIEGYYNVNNIPPGKYRIQFSLVGYQTLIVQDVLITTDQTTKLDAALEETVLEQKTVLVTAQKPIVDINLTSSMVSLSGDDIQALPVQEIRDIVNLQAGVVDGHFRGGRQGEVQYQVNGVTVNNSFDNTSILRLDRSLLQEVQVISGTFDAEYGQAMSGVVNAVLKSGTEDFKWNAELYTGDFLYPGSTKRLIDYKLRPLSLQNYQIAISGPTPIPKTYFLFNTRRSISNDYFYGTRRFIPTDSSDFEKKIFAPTGDQSKVPLGYSNEWSGLAKITNKPVAHFNISYQAILNFIEAKRTNFAWRLNPDGTPTQKTFSLVHGIDVTHTLSNSTFYNIGVRQNYLKYTDYVYEDVFDPRYIDAGPPQSDGTYELGAVIQGVDLSRFKQQTNTYVIKASVTSQVTRDHQLKAGVELQYSNVEFGSPGYILQTTEGGVMVLRPKFSQPPEYPGILLYRPLSISAYAQDQIEWQDLTLRFGARSEYFDSRATIPSDLQNPANNIAGAPQSYPIKATKKITVAPRLGVSYPITTRSALFFAYGHFYQLPGLGQIFTNSDYTILKELQAGGVSYGVLGNPDIKPERTIQYEFGYKNELTDFLGMDISVFYKDIRDLLGVEFISTYTAAEYARLTNVDFGNVIGFTFSLDQRRIGLLSTSLDYTWQMAQGNSSDPRETATRAAAGEDPRPRQVPLNWDQRNTLNLTVMLQDPKNFSFSAVSRLGSGQPYTPAIGAGFGQGLEANSGRKPNHLVVDLRGEKFFTFSGFPISVFFRVFNLFDTKFANGFVFSDTGNPDYSLNPIGDRAMLANPTRFYPPRRIEIGLTIYYD